MEEAAFRELAGRIWDEMPERFKAKVANVALLVEDEPSEEVRQQEGLVGDDTLLGLYQGIPATLRGSEYGVGGTLPDTITLYRLPLMDEAHELMHERSLSEEAALEEAIRETIWHEVGHYFGLEEDPINHREGEGTNKFES